MKYNNVVHGIFVDRPNRFIAHVLVNDIVETVHVKNTGRCRELLIPGAHVILEVCDNPNRKTKYDLICVYKEGIGIVNMDSQAPNKVVGEWLRTHRDITFIKPEYTYGKSRIDFYFEMGEIKCLMEVKGVTLEKDKKAYFPDAPTLRGVKHLKELIGAIDAGYRCYVAFVIQMEEITEVYANEETHLEFAKTLEAAKRAGVTILNLETAVTEDTLKITSEIEKITT
ncbi:MAG: DNA/RNA nuclease SfsA [Clostridiales bacterium]|nr:DNA/RNA nuclease SfsA [Clostridiales bacterium]